MSTELRNFLSLSYDELEQLNLKAKSNARTASPPQSSGRAYQVPDGREANQGRHGPLQRLEGRLHMLDYDKKFLVKSWTI